MSTYKRVAGASQGSVLTTELNSLANGGFSAFGTAYDNTTNLFIAFSLGISLATLTPTGTPSLTIFVGQSLDGTNYEDPPSSTNQGFHMAIIPVSLNAAAGAKLVNTRWFPAFGVKYKFALVNNSGVALNASTNVVTLYASYDQSV